MNPPSNREDAMRKVLATTEFTFVGGKVLIRNAAVLAAVAELQRQAEYSPGLVAAGGHLPAVPAR